MNYSSATKLISRHEGYRQFPYKCTAGKTTVGWGRNLQNKGISRKEAMYLLQNDIQEAAIDLDRLFPHQFVRWPESVQNALVDMRFQLGWNGFRTFQKMIRALYVEDFSLAAHEALDWKYAKQDTPGRAEEIAGMIRSGANN